MKVRLQRLTEYINYEMCAQRTDRGIFTKLQCHHIHSNKINRKKLLVVKHVFHFRLQLLFETSLAPTNVQKATHEMQANKHVSELRYFVRH